MERLVGTRSRLRGVDVVFDANVCMVLPGDSGRLIIEDYH